MRVASSSTNRASLSYLLTFGIVAFTRYSIYPWLLLHIQARKYESWAQAVVSYGALLTFLNLGITAGQTTASYSKQLSNSFFMVVLISLTSAYISLAFVTRFALMTIQMFSIGFSGALLSGFSLSLDKGSPSLTFHRKSSENDSNSNLERGVVCFTFATLLGSLLYDARAFANYPALNLAIFIGVVYLMMMFYHLVLAGAIAQKTGGKVKIIGNNHKSNSSSNASGKPGSMSSGDLRSLNTDVEVDTVYEGDVPVNFLSCCRGDIVKARKMYGKMLAWRKQHDVDNIFQQPQRFFKEILEYYPHGIHGYSLDGCGVVYEVLGRGNPRGLDITGVTIDELVWHFNIRNELVLKHLCDPASLEEAVRKHPPGAITITPFPYQTNEPGVLKQPVPRLMTVIDVQGISITSVTTQVISFIKKSGEIIDNYYPEQVARLVVCRAPRWFSTIWTVIARVLPEAVQKKVDILYDAKGLDKYIHPSQRPKEYGGTDVDLGEWEGHKRFVQISEEWKKQSAALTIQTDNLHENSNSGHHASSSNLPAALSPKRSTSNTDSSSNNDSNNTNNKNEGKGVVGWLVNRFSNGNKGTRPTTAYLGEKNSYRFNGATGMWEMDVDTMLQGDDEEDGRNKNPIGRVGSGSVNNHKSNKANNISFNKGANKGNSMMASDDEYYDSDDHGNNANKNSSPRTTDNMNNSSSTSNNNGSNSRRRLRNKKDHMSQEQIEEHGLVLAIQAAHFASQYASQQKLSSSASSSSLPVHSNSFANLEMGLHSPANGNGYHHPRGGSGLEREFSGNSRSLEAVNGGMGDSTVNGSGDSLLNGKNGPILPFTKLSSSIFLIVILIFVLTTSMQMMLTTLLPVWLCAPLKSGGLGYNVRDLGLQLSCCGLLVLHGHLFFGAKIDHVLRASPVRALRIGSGLMCAALLVLPIYARWFTVPLEDVLHHSSSHESTHFGLDETEQRTTSLWRWHHHNMQAMLLEAESMVLSSLQGLSPSTSLFSLLVCALLISTLICMSHLCRKASGMLLHLVLSAVFQNPGNIRHALYSLADILGPLLSCVVYSVVYSSHIRFPLNSSFFFPFSASMAVLSYILSMFLVVHFRGDYGIMSDYQDWRTITKSFHFPWFSNNSNNNHNRKSIGNHASNKNNSNASAGGRAQQTLSQRHSNNSTTSSSNADVQRTRSFSTDSLMDDANTGSNVNNSPMNNSNYNSSGGFYNEANDPHLFAIPLGDLNLLFSTVGYGYGSKLYNLKDDFKDV